MRTFLSAVAALAAVVLCFAAVPALWLDHHVVQEDGFLALTAPLGEDEQFQQSLADASAEAALQDAGLPPALNQLAQPLIEGAAQALVDDPQYPQAWTETLRKSHQLTFGEAQAGAAEGTGALVLDIAPLVSLLSANAADAVGAEIPAPDQVPVTLGGANQQHNIDLAVRYAGLGMPFAIAAAAAFVLALVAARRRSTTVALIGAGLLLAAGAWKLGADFLAQQLEAGAQGNPLGSLFAGYFVDAAQASFLMWIIAGAAAGAVLVMVGVIARIFAGSQN